MRYPARFEASNDGFTVTFRDIPEAITDGETLEEAHVMAADALLTAMDFYFEDRRNVPLPSKMEDGEELIELPASVWAKVLLLNEMLEQHVTQSELARRLHTRPQDVQRIVDLGHVTKIDRLAEAMAALGKRLEMRIA